MKTIYILFFAIIFTSFFSCDEKNDLIEIKDQAGLIINTSNYSGSLLGSPILISEVEQETILISEALLNYEINLLTGSTDIIDKIELVKTFSGDPSNTEVIVTETSELPFLFSLNSINDFLTGFTINEADLRIGDYFTFKLKIHQNDGDVYYYETNNDIILTINDPSINDILNITTSWDNSFTFSDNGNTTTVESCNEVDFDVYLYDLNLNFIATIAESADCPEIGSISGLEDGKYMIGVFLYFNGLSSYSINETLPITIIYSQDGFIEETSFVNTEFSTNDAWDDFKEVFVAQIEVVDGHLYTVTPL